jgi:hypothetical protein
MMGYPYRMEIARPRETCKLFILIISPAMIFLLLFFLYFPVSYIFPAVGLAAVAAKALTITDENFIVAAKALAELVPQEKLKDGCCYPDLSNIREVAQKIAVAVAEHMFDAGRSEITDRDCGNFDYWLNCCNKIMYNPCYPAWLGPETELVLLQKITDLYRFYIADSVVGNWKKFIKSVFEATRKVFLEEISESSYNCFIDKCNSKIGFDVLKLIQCKVNPAGRFKEALTVQEQKDFISDMESYYFESDLKPFTDEMIPQLKSVTEFRFMPSSAEQKRKKVYRKEIEGKK